VSAWLYDNGQAMKEPPLCIMAPPEVSAPLQQPGRIQSG
jgi:hypothetical protein